VGDAPRQKWSLTQEAFDGLLAALGPDRDLAASRYLEIRRNLVRLFEWRGSSTPEEYADEALNRCARKLAEGEDIRDVGTYAVGVARMVLRESARYRDRQARPLDEAPDPCVPPLEPAGDDNRVECLRRCLAQLPPESRDLILSYYRGDSSEKIRSRKRLAGLLQVPPSTLRMRALRVREALQLCTRECVRGRGSRV
jgi:DNA-directed RNA polymerase specialized sigma24 family protein